MLALVPEAQSDDAVTTRSTQFTVVGALVGANVGFKLREGTTVGKSVTEGIGDGKGVVGSKVGTGAGAVLRVGRFVGIIVDDGSGVGADAFCE